MWMYICNNSRTVVSFTVNQCVRYTHNPMESHIKYLKYVGCYLKGTRDKYVILNSRQSDLKLLAILMHIFLGCGSRRMNKTPTVSNPGLCLLL